MLATNYKEREWRQFNELHLEIVTTLLRENNHPNLRTAKFIFSIIDFIDKDEKLHLDQEDFTNLIYFICVISIEHRKGKLGEILKDGILNPPNFIKNINEIESFRIYAEDSGTLIAPPNISDLKGMEKYRRDFIASYSPHRYRKLFSELELEYVFFYSIYNLIISGTFNHDKFFKDNRSLQLYKTKRSSTFYRNYIRLLINFRYLNNSQLEQIFCEVNNYIIVQRHPISITDFISLLEILQILIKHKIMDKSNELIRELFAGTPDCLSDSEFYGIHTFEERLETIKKSETFDNADILKLEIAIQDRQHSYYRTEIAESFASFVDTYKSIGSLVQVLKYVSTDAIVEYIKDNINNRSFIIGLIERIDKEVNFSIRNNNLQDKIIELYMGLEKINQEKTLIDNFLINNLINKLKKQLE